MKKDDMYNVYEDVMYEEFKLKEREKEVRSKRAINLIYFMLFILPFIISALIAIFAHIELDISAKMWWAGFIASFAGMILYLSYGSTFRIVKHSSAVLFAWGLFFFFLAIWLMPDDPAYDLKKLVGLIVLTVIVVIIVILLIYMIIRKRHKTTRKKKAFKIVMKKAK